MNMYMYICMYIHIRTHVCMCVSGRSVDARSLEVSKYMYVYVCIYTYMYTHIYTHIYTYIHIKLHVYVCTWQLDGCV